MKLAFMPAGIGIVLVGLSGASWAHGTMEVPVNRVYSCYQEGAESPKTPACQEAKRVGGTQAMYDWNGINQNPPGDNHQAVVPDGTLCGAGQSKFKGFNLARTDWPATNIVPNASGNFEFIYKAPAPHATKYFRFYVTKNGWNPSQPLKWSDLELFGTYNGNPPLDASQRYHMTMKLPTGKTGRHIIYNVWKRSDSEEAFYSCSDVNFGNGGPQPEPPPISNPWKEVGSVTAHENLPNKSSVTLRIFDGSGRDVESYKVDLSATTGQAANWPYELGVKVNASSQIGRIGVISSKQRTVTINPVRSATANRVWLNERYSGYRYQIDIKKGDDVVTPPPAGDVWREGVAYTVGQVVSHEGRRYRCLQAHTAWVGAYWTPSTTPALWTPI